jgi:hypothetical protein
MSKILITYSPTGETLPTTVGNVEIKVTEDRNFIINDSYGTIFDGSAAGGSQTLQDVTDLGNTTTNDIQFGAAKGVLLDNGSKLKEGTIDAGNGGSKGISQICAVGYEMKWEAGRLYIMNDGGTTIREVSHNFSSAPTVYDDITKGFVVGTRWLKDNGDLYICTDNTLDEAVWDLSPAPTSGTSGTSGISGSSGTNGQGFEYQGNWVDSTNYVPYDVVTYNGSAWITPSASLNQIPGSAGDWFLFVQSGSNGTSGISGSSGQNGLSASYYRYNAITGSQAPPISDGDVEWNNATQTGSTVVYLSHVTQDSNDIEVILGSTGIGSTLIIQDRDVSENYQRFTVTDITVSVGAYVAFGVTYLNGGYSFSNNHNLIVIVQSVGVAGTAGTSGISGSSGSSGAAGAAGTSGTSGGGGGASAVKLANETITATGWTYNTGTTYYEYTYSYSGITTGSTINITPYNDYLVTAQFARIFPYIQSNSGNATITAMYVPGANIIGEVIIT